MLHKLIAWLRLTLRTPRGGQRVMCEWDLVPFVFDVNWFASIRDQTSERKVWK